MFLGLVAFERSRHYPSRGTVAALPATHPVDQAHWKLYASSEEGLSDTIEHNQNASRNLRGSTEADEDT